MKTLTPSSPQLDLAEIDPRERWRRRPPEEFPSPWASEWGFDEFGLWQSFEVSGEINGKPKQVTHKMRFIPKGQFLMGSPEDEPGRRDRETQHLVELTKGFWLGETTVMQDLWHLIMGNNPSDFEQQNNEQLPVEQVSWDDCQQFCTALNQRIPGLHIGLPSEAQWEYACRAGTTSPFSVVGSDGEQITSQQVNFRGNYPYEGRRKLSDAEQAQFAAEPRGKVIKYREKTIDVHAFPANEWGLKQMHGNVWEWCADAMRSYAEHSNIEQHASDPLGECSANTERFAVRGGSWIVSAQYCRSAFRGSDLRDFRDDDLGLRVACFSAPLGDGSSSGAGKSR